MITIPEIEIVITELIKKMINNFLLIVIDRNFILYLEDYDEGFFIRGRIEITLIVSDVGSETDFNFIPGSRFEFEFDLQVGLPVLYKQSSDYN